MTIKLSIAPEMKAKCPRVALAAVTAAVHAGDTPEELFAELLAAGERIAKLPEPRAVLESPAILATRQAYKALGKDPARYRGSAEALLRRVISGKGLPRIHAVVDVINLVSVEYRLSVGLYDAAHLAGDIVFRPGRPGETYKGIGKYDLNLEGMPLFSDEHGPHGSPTSDSERTMVTRETTNVLAVVVSFGGRTGLDAAAGRMKELLERYAAATAMEIQVIE